MLRALLSLLLLMPLLSVGARSQSQSKGSFLRDKQPPPPMWRDKVGPAEMPIEKTSNFPDGLLVGDVRPIEGGPPSSVAGHEAPPRLLRLRGRLEEGRIHTRSLEGWAGFSLVLAAEDGERYGVRSSALVSSEALAAKLGERVEVLLHPLPRQRGRWVVMPLSETPQPLQGPVGHGVLYPIEVDGQRIGHAQWHAGRPRGSEVLWIRSLGR